jgi:hypothetical protein
MNEQDFFFFKEFFFFEIFFFESFHYTFNFIFFFLNFDYFFLEFFSDFFDFYSFFFEFFNFYSFFDFHYLEVCFQTSCSNYNFVEFFALQKLVYILPNETHLIFFRMYNSINYEIHGISIYLIYPIDYLLFFNKIQCFCFEELLLYPYESIDLPVIFYVMKDILNDLEFYYTNKIYVSYLFLVR